MLFGDINLYFNFPNIPQQLISSILGIFWGLGILNFFESFKDMNKVLHGFFQVFEKWYASDHIALKKLLDVGISVKHHIFDDICQCT